MKRRTFIQRTAAASAAIYLSSPEISLPGVAADTNSNDDQGLYTNSKTKYPEIPRIESHCHVAGDVNAIANYHALRKLMLDTCGADLAAWINLGDKNHPIPDLAKIMKLGRNRMFCCISDYSAHDGLDIKPQLLKGMLDDGYAGYKIWSGPPHRRLKEGQEGFPYIDDPAHEPTFAKMEEIKMVCASIHIADPNGPYGNRTKWLSDPVAYWKQITAFRKVLERHPNLKVVAAHGLWLMCQDAQIDYLRNMLATFPNLHVDLAATFQYNYMVNPDNLRDFMIEWSDRILFGTDVGRWDDPSKNDWYAQRYFQCFQILETDHEIKGGFFDQQKTQGLALPKEVLEKIYFRNAMRVYPKARQHFEKLGYSI